LSHNWNDKEFVRRLYIDLINKGIKAWFDEAEMNPGDSLIEKIQQAIDEMDYLAVCLSPNSVTSQWVLEEVKQALFYQITKKRIKVLPILIKNCEIPGFLREKIYLDFRNCYYDAFNKLVTFLKEGRLKIERSTRVQVIDFIENLPDNIRLFDKDFGKSNYIQILQRLTDLEFKSLYYLFLFKKTGTIGITREFAINTISENGITEYEANTIFNSLVNHGFLLLSTDPDERNNPDPGYDYTDIFYKLYLLYETLGIGELNLSVGIMDTDYYLEPKKEIKGEQRLKMRLKMLLSNVFEKEKFPIKSIDIEYYIKRYIENDPFRELYKDKESDQYKEYNFLLNLLRDKLNKEKLFENIQQLSFDLGLSTYILNFKI
jgi:hypothetical protein